MFKTAVRSLADGGKEFPKMPKLMKEKFVFLNVYCRSVADEHKPRGPEGPYQFNDKSVPVVVIKKWDGETLHQKLGFSSDQDAGNRDLKRALDQALKKNGPITAPKALRPLIKKIATADKHLKSKRPSHAFKELQKVIDAGNDKKKFPKGPPTLAKKAAAKQEAIVKQGEEEIAKAEALATENPKKSAGTLKKLLRLYRGIPKLKALLDAKIEAAKK